MDRQALTIGLGTAILSLIGLARRQWILEQTPKGRTLLHALGPARAQMVLAGLLAVLFILGVSLAVGWITPLNP